MTTRAYDDICRKCGTTVPGNATSCWSCLGEVLARKDERHERCHRSEEAVVDEAIDLTAPELGVDELSNGSLWFDDFKNADADERMLMLASQLNDLWNMIDHIEAHICPPSHGE